MRDEIHYFFLKKFKVCLKSTKETGGLPFIFILKFFILLTGLFLFFELSFNKKDL